MDRTDVYIRTQKLSCDLFFYNNNESYYLSIALISKSCPNDVLVPLTCSSSNSTKCLKNSLFNLNHDIISINLSFNSTNTNKITQESVNSCITLLKNIKFLKKNKKYINLTKIFLTNPSFLFLAYLQIKNKSINTTKIVGIETLDAINSSAT
jgi:hypothetical protein